MYARTAKPQEGFYVNDSHAKCFKTTNSTAKVYRGAMYRGEVLRACFRHFLHMQESSNFYTCKNQTQILLKYLYTKHNF